MKKLLWLSLAAGVVCVSAAGPTPAPPPVSPGHEFQPPERPAAAGAPMIYEHSADAGPDETFLLAGERLTGDLFVWGTSANDPKGQAWTAKVQFVTNGLLAATLPDRAQDGPFVVWAKNAAGWSAPIVLNAPQPWWCGPETAAPGETVSVYGRNLARRPDFARAFVYLVRPGKTGVWPPVVRAGKYQARFTLGEETEPGEYEVWVHAGTGGRWGWGGPARLRVTAKARGPSEEQAAITLKPGSSGAEIQAALDAVAARGGGLVKLPPGHFPLSTTLRIPANTRLAGSGRDPAGLATVLELTHDPQASFPRLAGAGWSQAPGGIHTPGDTMEYTLEVPQAGEYAVWLRYATDMKPWNQPGVSGNHTLSVDGGAPVPLMNLENTGGFGAFKWSRAAKLKLAAGRRSLVWKNEKGGGISLDAFVFALDAQFVPPAQPPPANRAGVIVLQGEDCVRFAAKDGMLPGGDRAAIWLAGDGAGLRDLAVLGNARVNLGIALRSPDPLRWLTNGQVLNVRVADCEGKQGENCGLHARRADRCVVRDNELWGRAPLFISGARQTEFVSNRLVAVTRFGGNAEAAILGRTETIEECVVEGNVIASPPGALAGGPAARRLLWFSTGHGSITRNWIAHNGVEKPLGPGAETGAGQARFGGVAGTDQNVGEMILFEGNHRTMYFGPLAGAAADSVTLPQTVPPTPTNRLGSVKPEQLARDASGRETPFWPPDFDDGGEEPPIHEYYVSIFSGRGQGQTRRVIRREGAKLLLDRPWAVAPTNGCVVAVGIAFYQNHIVGNHTPDGMTGIQLWISCMENIIAGNSIARQRKPGFYLYANGTTLASSMPRTWNRGVSPLFWNVVEGNRAEECSAGALVISGDAADVPVEFPRALGNVLRHNSFVRSRTDGVILNGRKPVAEAGDRAAPVAGTLVEFNVVRDAAIAFHASAGASESVFRRNHAYFWYPVNNSTNAPVGFQLDATNLTAVIEKNSLEGIHGVHDGRIIDLKTPAGPQRLPER